MKNFLLFVFIFPVVLLSCQNPAKPAKHYSVQGPAAPELTTAYGWLNTPKAFTIKGLHGKIVLLDFWTLGCINCQHIIPDLEKLQQKYASQLVEIGVHSAKFESEKQTKRIQSAIEKFGINHPVVNDADYSIWKAYGVDSWPTLVLISPDGKIAFKAEGENVFETFDLQIDKLIREYGDSVNTQPIDDSFGTAKNVSGVGLRFPSKMIVDKENHIWLSDYGNNRIVKIDSTGKLLATIGSGKNGSDNGSFPGASFNGPQGLALKDNLLFIADSRNNSIRLADLSTNTVTTIAGNGQMGYYFNNNKRNEPVLPNSPWDLVIDDNDLYIADAGNHQVLRMALTDRKVFRYAGTGYEGIIDGKLEQATFSQPSGLTVAGGKIYVADPEASAIRMIDRDKQTVKTVIGKGLFKFGDQDGNPKDVLLQHCVGLTANGDNIYIADTYNGKIKLFNTRSNNVSTLVSGLDEPNDVLLIGEALWISDTNNNQLVKFNLATGSREIIKLH